MKTIIFMSALEFIQQYGFMIACIAAGLVFLVVLTFFIIAVIKRKKNLIEPPKNKKQALSGVNKEALLEGIGGLDNLETKSLSGSRISLQLKDVSKVDEEKLNSIGVDRVIKMSNKITLVIKGDISAYYRSLR